MADESIKMELSEVLELDYLVEKISDNTVNIKNNSSNISFSDEYISKSTYVFDPDETGSVTLEINGKTIEVTVIDWQLVSNGSFESGDLTNWTNINSGGFNVTTQKSYDGSYSVEVPSEPDIQIINSNASVGPPAKFRYRVYIPTNTGDSYDLQLVFGYQDSNNFYAFSPRNILRSKWFYKKDGGTYTRIIDDGNTSYDPRGSWHTLFVEWLSDGTMTGRIINESTDSTVWEITGTDSSFTSAGKVGIGYEPTSNEGISHADLFEVQDL